MSSPITEDEKHLDWSAKQGRILTDRGKALKYYSEENGFPFASEELPHYHLEIGDSNETYRKWSDEHHSSGIKCPIIGAWKRPLFTGKWEHSTDEDEVVFNIQTSTLFIDLRIPKSKPIHKWENMGKRSLGIGMKSCRDILQSFGDHDLRLYARQHVFGGFSVLSRKNFKSLPLCTRHHCIDWNYVPGKPRPRPNKWYIEGDRSSTAVDKPFDVWKEWSYARDDNGQCYYWERWERLLGDQQGNGLRLALRKRSEGRDNQRWLNTSDGRWLNISDKSRNVDGILVAVGDHFNYVVGREPLRSENLYPNASNVVELVDAAISNGDRDTAISYLSLDGGHGTISSGWVVDCAIQPWKHGQRVFDSLTTRKYPIEIKVCGNDSDFRTWDVIVGGSVWDVYECSLPSASDLEKLLQQSRSVGNNSRL